MCLSIGLGWFLFLFLVLLLIVGRTAILPLADSAAFGPFSLFCDWVLAVFMPIDRSPSPVINYQRQRRQTIIVCGEFPKRLRAGASSRMWHGARVCGISLPPSRFSILSSLFLGFHLGNIIFAVVSFGNLYEIFGITLTFAIYVHMRPVSASVSVTALLWLPSPACP